MTVATKVLPVSKTEASGFCTSGLVFRGRFTALPSGHARRRVFSGRMVLDQLLPFRCHSDAYVSPVRWSQGGCCSH